MTLLFSFSLYEATVLCLLSFVFLIILLTAGGRSLTHRDVVFGEEYLCEKCEEEQGKYEKSPWSWKESKIPRNETCPCGSGRKYKKCCGKDESPNLAGTKVSPEGR